MNRINTTLNCKWNHLYKYDLNIWCDTRTFQTIQKRQKTIQKRTDSMLTLNWYNCLSGNDWNRLCGE